METNDPDALERALTSIIDADDAFVVLHSALYAFGLPEAQLKWPLVRALRRLQARGHTIVVPSFTLSFLGGRAYHHRDGSFLFIVIFLPSMLM